MKTPKYIKAKVDIVVLLKNEGHPMTVAEIHQALIWRYNMNPIRRAVYALEREEIIAIEMSDKRLRCRLL